MFARRYTVVIADRSTGVVRRVTISLRAAVTSVTAVLMLPVLIGLGARWSALAEIAQLRLTNATLDVENSNFRANTGELTTQIQSLENVIDDLGSRSALEPDQARALQRLPAVVKSRATGGTAQPNAPISRVKGALQGSFAAAARDGPAARTAETRASSDLRMNDSLLTIGRAFRDGPNVPFHRLNGTRDIGPWCYC